MKKSHRDGTKGHWTGWVLGLGMVANLCLSLSVYAGGAGHNFGTGPQQCAPCHMVTDNGTTDPDIGAIHGSDRPAGAYTMYRTQEGNQGVLDAASRLCLSCHDGVNAAQKHAPRGGANLGTNLGNDHPVGVSYPPRGRDGMPLRRYKARPGNGLALVKVNSTDVVGCTTCHDPHGGRHKAMLRVDLHGSKLCFQCHDME